MPKVIAGNWKMHHGPAETSAFFADFHEAADPGRHRVVIFPPALSVSAAKEHAGSVEIGVQNVHWEPSGAYTGELSAEMSASSGASLVLIGHSERRHIFGETDEEVARKVEAVLRADLEPVVCVGETLEQRRGGALAAVLERQVGAVVSALSHAPAFMIAYEPVWAIGTGETATPQDASQAHGLIRRQLAEGGLAGATTPILYGGSVKPGNAKDLLSAPDVDGVLVGGASLSGADFAAIVHAAS